MIGFKNKDFEPHRKILKQFLKPLDLGEPIWNHVYARFCNKKPISKSFWNGRHYNKII